MIKLLRQLSCVSMCWLIAACGGSSPDPDGSGGPGKGGTTQETLVWSDEFSGAATQSAPNPANWTYDTGGGGWGNSELETYCAYGSTPRRATRRIQTHMSEMTAISISLPVNLQAGCTPRHA